ncbi:MAG: outer membrane beta-barrel protein [Acidobacteria bacterium]|nr:outer membrane beta-barrel protein [Acidobacteriota bacterium]
MRKLLFLLFLFSVCQVVVQAQDDVPPFEIFGGYTYLKTGSGYDQDLHGWNTSVSGNLTRHFAIKADFAGHYDNYTVRTAFNNVEVDNSLHTFMFGPQFNMRSSDRVNPFIHAIFGVARDITNARQGNARATIADTGFAMALGGGVDAKLGEHVSWRVFQTDYLLTRYRNPQRFPVRKESVHHFRVATGLVFH